MRRLLLWALGILVVAFVALSAIGRNAERSVAERQHYDKIKKVDLGEQLRKAAEIEEFMKGIRNERR